MEALKVHCLYFVWQHNYFMPPSFKPTLTHEWRRKDVKGVPTIEEKESKVPLDEWKDVSSTKRKTMASSSSQSLEHE